MGKGVMFSFIMVFITLSVLALIAIQNSLVTERREQIFVETRINSMNNMYESMTKDIDKSLQIISRRAVSVAFSNVSVSEAGIPPHPLDEANETLAELILNGTLEGTEEPLMENATFNYWIDRIKELSILKGFDMDVSTNSLVVKPYDYLHLLVKTEMDIDISDKQGVAEINRSVTVNSIVSLEGLEDPLYPLYTNGLGSNVIRRSPYLGNYTQLLMLGSGGNGYDYGTITTNTVNFDGKILLAANVSKYDLEGGNAIGAISEEEIVGSISIPYIVNSSALSFLQGGMNVLLDGGGNQVWFIDNLIEDTKYSYYHPSENGPSYLDRLEGEFVKQDKYESPVNKTIGMESFVNKIDLSSIPGISVNEGKTNIDYIYFSSSSPSSKKVKGLDKIDPNPYFRIDNQDEHEKSYNVTDLVTS